MLIIGLGNTGNADFPMFFTQYNNPALWKFYGASEHGYQFLMTVFRHFSLPFIDYRNFLLLIGIILVVLTVMDITESVSAVLALFFFVPFIINITQYRFFFASAICLFASRFLLKDKKYGIPIYIVAVIVAGLFHTSTLYYMFFVVIRFLNEKHLKYCAVGGTFFALLLIPTGVMRKLLQSMTTEEKASAYFGKSQSLGVVLAWLLVLCMVLFIEYSLSSRGYTSQANEAAFNAGTLDRQSKKIAYLELIRRMNYLCLPILILLFFDVPSCYRLFRGLLYMEYAAFFVAQYELKPLNMNHDDRERLMLSFGLVALCGVNFWALTTMHTIDMWFYPILEQNMFW
ncbi:EpsG family [Bifidobacterium margollesii]|uniref:EpsG family n=2 Tax=Bifidobacterium margollesii TaxID=2020964 RepID=A0A2N5J8Y1_9BIFI|nr:EpsG family [Bifidobacterium margollesii]